MGTSSLFRRDSPMSVVVASQESTPYWDADEPFSDPCPSCGSYEAYEDEDERGIFWCACCGARVE